MIDNTLVLSTEENATIPQSIRDLVNSGRTFLGLDPAWHIYLKMNEKPLGSDQNAGCAHSRPTYLNAHLEFAPCVEEETKKIRNEYVWHELMHISMSEMDTVVDEIMAFLPKDKKKLLKSKYENEGEQFIQRTIRGMLDNPEILKECAASFQEKSDGDSSE